ncbi:non-canonical purine NTP pyrophosphatase [Nocardioides sp. LS1]|uniref:non-canonical purine NTP pyrophosphatase n=1 Tax=Nocardioides sp. LS1 TaxID=1027620 RepID=UPI00163B0E55|nr:non-canonical purine NTP pyrophosphatase [Nocardioides sp. LS1]
MVFFTSSASKYLQARLVFSMYGLDLTQRAHDDREYSEDYSGSPTDLLKSAVNEVNRRSGGGALFFIEDTSIRIEALSRGAADQPGLRAKEWFADTSFNDLQDAIDTNGGDRRATVTSRIALSLPGLNRPQLFEGSMSGEIVSELPNLTTDPLYPWLASDNFSAWIVPDGADRTLSGMSFEQSLEFDFRVRSLRLLVDRLEEYALVANAGPPVFIPPARVRDSQPTLFTIDKPIILVIGPTCAGKSTFGAIAQADSEAQVVDASSIVRIIREERDQAQIDIGTFATELLRDEGPDVVARRISSEFIDDKPRDKPIIITGFRAIEEIEFMRESAEDIRVISIETPARLRYERYQKRGTRRDITTFDEFQDLDAEQHALGLLPVASTLADLRIENVHSLEIYYQQIASVLDIQVSNPDSVSTRGVSIVHSRLDPDKSQLLRCLKILRRAGRPLTTQEIEAAFDDGPPIRYNNANKMLKRYPQLVRRQESRGANVRYQMTPAGLAFLSAIEKMNRA